MVKIYQQPFAHAGTKQVIPDASDPQGFVSNEDGFTTDYELPDTDPNYKPIERAEFNGLMNMVTEAVGELQQFGFAKWQPIQWPQGARVVEGGVVYRALTQTAQQPPHADWMSDMDALTLGLGTAATRDVTTYETDATAGRLLKVGDNVERVVNTIFDLLGTSGQTVKTVRVLNYHGDVEGGGGAFYWDATKAKSEHNGGTIVDPTVGFPTDWNNQTQLGTWFDTSNAGTGCWVRQYDCAVNVKWFGAKGDGVTDDTVAIQNSLLIAGIFVPEGVYICGNVHVFKSSINGVTKKSTLKAKNGASTVLFLGNNGDWDFTTISNINVDGNLKNSNGVTFGERSDGLDGRYTFENVLFTQCDKAIYKPRGNIGQEYNRVTVVNSNFGFYAIGQNSPIMHAGCDVFNACHFGGGITVAGWYINNNTDSYGQTVLNDCICEGNSGASVVIKNTGQLYQGVVVNNLWTEANTLNANILIEGVSYQTADYIFDNAKDILIVNTFIKAVYLTNYSTLFLRDCRIDPQAGYFFVTKDSTSYVESSGQYSYRLYSTSSIISKDIRLNTYRPNSLTNSHHSVYRTMDNTSKVSMPSNKVISRSFEVATTLSGTNIITSTPVAEGNLYTNAGLFNVSAGGQHLIGNFTTEAGKFYVVTLTSKTTGTVNFIGDAGNGSVSKFNGSDEFITQKAVIYAGEVKTISPWVIGGTSGGTLTIREYQAVKFNTAEEAYSFLNSTKYVE